MLAKYLHVRDQGGFEAVQLCDERGKFEGRRRRASWEANVQRLAPLKMDHRRELGFSDAEIVWLHHVEHARYRGILGINL